MRLFLFCVENLCEVGCSFFRYRICVGVEGGGICGRFEFEEMRSKDE